MNELNASKLRLVAKPRVGDNALFCTSGGDQYFAAIITRVGSDNKVDLFVMPPADNSYIAITRALASVPRSSMKNEPGTWCLVGEYDDE